MFKYIVKRILSSILVLLGVVTITFFIARVLPSNPEVKWAGQRATPEQLEAARIELGLDKSLPEQYIIYLGDLLHGDLGKSLNNHQPVTAELARYIPATLELVLLAFGLAIIIGIPLGIYSAKKKCPNLVIVPPHHDLYEEYSQRINDIYAEYTDQVEKFGIDESWLDVTGSQKLFGTGTEIAA